MIMTTWALAYYKLKSPNRYDAKNKTHRDRARKNFQNTEKLDFELALKALKTALDQENTEGVEFLKKKGWNEEGDASANKA